MSLDYSDKKLEIIKNYSTENLLKFLNEIKGSEERKRLNQLLEPFVDEKLKHEKNNAIKFGTKTKERYCLAIKNELEGFFASSNKQKKCSTYDKAKTIFPEIFLCWVSSNIAKQLSDYIKNKNIDKKELDISDLRFVGFLIEQNSEYLISQEAIETFYKLSPIIPSPNYDEKIQNCKTGLDIIKHLQNGQPLNDKITEYETKISEIMDNNTSLQNELEEKANEIDFWESENKKLEKELSRYKNTDIDKMKESFKSQLTKKETENNILKQQLEDYENIVLRNEKLLNDNSKLEAINKIKISELYTSLDDEIYLTKFKKLIFRDKKLTSFIANKLNLKSELMEQADSIYQQKFLEEEIELEKLKEQKLILNSEIEELKMQSKENKKNAGTPMSLNMSDCSNNALFSYNASAYLNLLPNEDKFKEEFRYSLNKEDNDYDFNLHNKIKNKNIIIVEDKRDIYTWLKCAGIDFKPLEIVVEYNWTSYDDWFGYFKNNEFCPARTLIADYYKFVKETENLPFGFVIFNDFNKILPEVYLEPYFQNLEVNGYIDLINPNCITHEKDLIFKRIEKLDKLKYILVKSKDNDSFDIPSSFAKYEVNIND